jgi:hypothetical protein
MSYKALTRLHLPVIEKDYAPGELVSDDDLKAAGQGKEQIEQLKENGALGGENADLHPSSIVPRPDMPTIERVVMEAKQIVNDLESKGEEVPDEVRVMANLDYKHAVTGDEAQAGDASA